VNEPVIKKQEKEEKDELVILFPKHCKIEEWTYTKLGEDVLNIIVRTKKIEKKREKKEICLSKEEEELLKKLLKIKFEERSLKRVSEELTKEELCMVKKMLEKRLVSIYRKGKYAKEGGVINIKDEVYPLLFKREKKEHHENKESANNNEKNSEKKINYLAFLREKGYVVVKRKEDIQIVSDELRKRGLAKKVKGVVGFDGNLYLCTLSFLEKMEVAIKRLLKRQKEIDLKRMLKKDEMKYEAYKTALTLLLEKGEIIEKERDVFCLA
jgi:predicted GNAT family acetyltransferase